MNSELQQEDTASLIRFLLRYIFEVNKIYKISKNLITKKFLIIRQQYHSLILIKLSQNCYLSFPYGVIMRNPSQLFVYLVQRFLRNFVGLGSSIETCRYSIPEKIIFSEHTKFKFHIVLDGSITFNKKYKSNIY